LEQATNYRPSPQHSALQEAARRASKSPSIAELVGHRDESIRGDLNRAVEEQEARQQPPPPPPPDSKSHDYAGIGLFELLGLIFGLPAGDALYHGKPIDFRMLCFIAAGCFFAGLGTAWPAVRRKFPQQALVLSIGRIASDARYWLAIILVGFLYAASPAIYHRAVAPEPSAPTDMTGPSAPALCSDGPCAPVRLRSGPQYLKEIGLGIGPEPLSFGGTSVVTAERLRVFVDYSEYRSGWMPKTRAFIGELKEPVKGKRERDYS
jgi:hypothetical protein